MSNLRPSTVQTGGRPRIGVDVGSGSAKEDFVKTVVETRVGVTHIQAEMPIECSGLLCDQKVFGAVGRQRERAALSSPSDVVNERFYCCLPDVQVLRAEPDGTKRSRIECVGVVVRVVDEGFGAQVNDIEGTTGTCGGHVLAGQVLVGYATAGGHGK